MESIITMVVANWSFSTSIVLSSIISWHSSKKKKRERGGERESFPFSLFIHLFTSPFVLTFLFYSIDYNLLFGMLSLSQIWPVEASSFWLLIILDISL